MARFCVQGRLNEAALKLKVLGRKIFQMTGDYPFSTMSAFSGMSICCRSVGNHLQRSELTTGLCMYLCVVIVLNCF